MALKSWLECWSLSLSMIRWQISLITLDTLKRLWHLLRVGLT
jgi:hypothetical protein